MPAWLPKSGLIRAHHDYGTYCTDAPPVYHVASMATTIATAVGDTAHLVLDGSIHPLNIWTMIVGQSSSDRKTTATKLAVDRLETAIESRILRIFGSPEGFIDSLQDEPCSMLYISEGAAFFEQREAGYWRHAKGMFMDLYDHTPYFRRKLAKREIEIQNPRLSILSACAFQLLDYHTRVNDWLGGFLPRFLMIMGDKMPFRPLFRENANASRQIEGLLFNVYHHPWGAIACSTEAAAVLSRFAYEINDSIPAFHDNLHPSLNRLPEMSVRLSAIYEIAKHAHNPSASTHLMVSAESAQHAVALCRESRDRALVHLAETTEINQEARDILRVETIVRRYGLVGLKRRDLLRKARMQSKRLDDIITTLIERESIKVTHEKTLSKKGGRPAVRYVHTEAEADELRAAQNLAIDPEPKAWIPVEDWATDPPVLDGLPIEDEEDERKYVWSSMTDDDDDDDPTRWN